jgi:hypothetical protein
MYALPSLHSFALNVLPVLAFPLLFIGCDSSTPRSNDSGFTTNNCTLPTNRLEQGCPGADCIPSIDDVTPGDRRLLDAEGAGALTDTSRVIGLRIGGRAVAIPHSVLWTHEIVNFDNWNGRSIAVTYCPLTGSSLAFDRSAVDGAELGVSGLLFDNNLVMYDRRENESLWPQMNRQANCGAAVGTTLDMVPVLEMRWTQWRDLHPDTKVLTDGRGFARRYPYGDYEALDDPPFNGMSFDERRPPKERVLGLPAGPDGGVAVPFRALDAGGPVRVISVAVGGTQKTIFWSRDAEGAAAFETADAFSVQNGQIVDDATGSTWAVNGVAIDGPRAGEQLTPVDTAYVAFWFAWAAFQPETDLWTNDAE